MNERKVGKRNKEIMKEGQKERERKKGKILNNEQIHSKMKIKRNNQKRKKNEGTNERKKKIELCKMV